MKTRVYLTVDTEAAEERVIHGHPLPPQGYDLRVWGRFANQRRELGIPLLVSELEKTGLAATFFVEALGAHFFGEDGLKETCTFLQAHGQDVQLHTHPVQRVADFRTRGLEPESDDIAAYSIDQQTALLQEGLDLLVRAGVPRESLSGFRAGNYGASNDTWRAMARAGLTVSSSYNPCYFEKNCRMRTTEARAGLFRAPTSENDGAAVWELPISNFSELGGAPRHVQITAVSLDETLDYLRQARDAQLGEVTVVTHSFELCHIDDLDRRLGRPNSVNLLRFRGLCRFLDENRSEFDVDTVGALGGRLRAGEVHVAAPMHLPRGSKRLKPRRLLEQAWKRLEARVHLDPGALFL